MIGNGLEGQGEFLVQRGILIAPAHQQPHLGGRLAPDVHRVGRRIGYAVPVHVDQAVRRTRRQQLHRRLT